MQFQTEDLGLRWVLSVDIGKWKHISEMVAMESNKQIVICGKRTTRDALSLYMFQNNSDCKLIMEVPCLHGGISSLHHDSITSMFTVIRDGKQLLAVFCIICQDVKLIDLETLTFLSFKVPDEPRSVCSGRNGGFFVCVSGGKILEFDSSFNLTNRFYPGVYYCSFMSYLPLPYDVIVIITSKEIIAFSPQHARQMWRQTFKDVVPHYMLFNQLNNLLLVSDGYKPEILILNPNDGSTLRTVCMSDFVKQLCLSNDQLVIVQRADDNTPTALSYYAFERTKSIEIPLESASREVEREVQDITERTPCTEQKKLGEFPACETDPVHFLISNSEPLPESSEKTVGIIENKCFIQYR